MKTSNIDYKCYEQGEYRSSFLSEDGPRIPTLPEKGGVKRIVGRTILDCSKYLGSYGMGGPGFFGFHLKAKSYYPEEWLVLTIWSAAEWLLMDGVWLEASHGHFDAERSFFKENYTMFSTANNQIKSTFTGLTIAEFKLHRKSFYMLLQDETKVHKLELPSDLKRLPVHGNDTERKWFSKDKLENGFIVSPTAYINI